MFFKTPFVLTMTIYPEEVPCISSSSRSRIKRCQIPDLSDNPEYFHARVCRTTPAAPPVILNATFFVAKNL